MLTVSYEDLVSASKEFDDLNLDRLPKEYSPYTVSPLDETKEDSPVHFVGTDGISRLLLNQDDFHYLKEWLESPLQSLLNRLRNPHVHQLIDQLLG